MRPFHTFLIIYVAGIWLVSNLEAQEPVELTVTPRAIERPLMKYRLLPAEYELKDGNAATIMLRLPWEQKYYMTEVVPTFDDYLNLSLDDPKLLEDKAHFNPHWVNELRRAAYRRIADWEYPIGENSAAEILLPDVQQLRNIIGHGLSMWIRQQIVKENTEQALEGIKIGLATTRHISQTPFMIQQLVCKAINSLMIDRIEELHTLNNCPNLYWALTDLPNNLTNYQGGLEFEEFIWKFPPSQLGNLEHLKSEEEWAKEADNIARINLAGTPPEQLKTQKFQLLKKMSQIARKELPGLIEGGQKRVDSMSDTEAGLRYYLIKEQDKFQELSAYAALEPAVAYPLIKAMYDRSQNELDKDPLNEFGLTVLKVPHLNYLSMHYNQRKIAALRIVEAIRHFAATHDGKLPEQLNDIKSLPVPNDPFTGNAFEYVVTDQKATLVGPGMVDSKKRDYSVTYHIKIKK